MNAPGENLIRPEIELVPERDHGEIITLRYRRQLFAEDLSRIDSRLLEHLRELGSGEFILYSFEDPRLRARFYYSPSVEASDPISEPSDSCAISEHSYASTPPRLPHPHRLGWILDSSASEPQVVVWEHWKAEVAAATDRPFRAGFTIWFQVFVMMDHNITLFQEFDDPAGLSLAPEIVFHATTADLATLTVNNAVLESENQASRIEEINGLTIAVEATWYLQTLLDTPPAKEPLLSALGGLPYWLRSEIEEDLDLWKKNGVTPLFVFDGLSIVGQEEMSLRTAKEAAVRSEEAWALYCVAKTPEQTNAAVTAFGNSGAIQAKTLYRFFQEILFERRLAYETATHSACAHMAHLDKNPIRSDGVQVFEAIMGSPELLLYDIELSVITKLDFNTGIYFAIVKSSLPEKLKVSEETLTNALLMTGTSFLPTFPVLKETDIIKQQPFTITDAINMYRTAHKSMITLCDTWTEIIQKQEPNWADKYRKAKMAIKHNVHLAEGDMSNTRVGSCVVVNDYGNLTGDHHEYIGLELPDELYHYLIHGNIGRRLMNWLTYLETIVLPPLDGGDAEEYRRLVTEQLIPIQAQSITLYTSRMHRAFQHKNFAIRFWFDNTATVVINHQTAQPAPEVLAATWRVKQISYSSQTVSTGEQPGSFSFAIMTLQDVDFASSTMERIPEVQNLKSQSEVLSNTMWRLLHLRGYVNEAHRPTVWGEALAITFNELSQRNLVQLEEAAFLAFELLQLDQLNARVRHEEWIGAPQRGSESDKTHCLLISRCACLLKLRHKEKGYTGPLSKNLLAYHSIIAAVREADRDLAEAIVGSMFMFAHADRRYACDNNSTKVRKRNNLDWTNLGFNLPFGKDVDVGLGIAVKTYLDDYSKPNATEEQVELRKINYVREQLPDSVDFAGDLEIAFDFFNALYMGVKTLGSAIIGEDLSVWETASSYLAERR